MTTLNTNMKVNPLSKKRITGIGTWEEWLILWEQTTSAEMLVSMLHYGFDTAGEIAEKVIFYLRIANQASLREKRGDATLSTKSIPGAGGHATSTTLHKGIGHSFMTTVHGKRKHEFSYPQEGFAATKQLQKKVMQKALEQLCVHFFSEAEKRNLEHIVHNHVLLKCLLEWFSSKENRQQPHHKHHCDIYIAFITQLVSEIWMYSDTNVSSMKGKAPWEKDRINTHNQRVRLCQKYKQTILQLIDDNKLAKKIFLSRENTGRVLYINQALIDFFKEKHEKEYNDSSFSPEENIEKGLADKNGNTLMFFLLKNKHEVSQKRADRILAA